MKFPRVLLALVFLFLVVSSVRAERVVIVGDSITGHSMNLPCGYVRELRKTIKEAGIADLEVVPLGASGSTVRSWLPFVEQSYTQRRKLDIPDIYVKDELDKPADTVFVFLGMNDATCPTVRLTPESLAQWRQEYQSLIDALRKRFVFKKLVLCSPTMLTEDPWSNRNILMDEMTKSLYEVAKANGAQVCDIRAEIKRHFLNARLTNPEFFFTPDCVHPRREGHAIMAWSILKALGRDELARKYYVASLPESFRNFNAPGMSLFVQHGDEPNRVTVRGFLRGADVKSIKVETPTGIKLEEIVAGPDGAFTLRMTGHCDELKAGIAVAAGNLRRTATLNAPFYVAMPFDGAHAAGPASFDWNAENTTIDSDILAGRDPRKSIIDGKPVHWFVCYPTPNVTGRESCNSVDFASIADMKEFDKAYVVRYIDSKTARKAKLKIVPDGFSTTDYVRIYLNGTQVWQDAVSPRLPKHRDEITVDLKPGVNILVARVNHTQWQWALTLDLE